jgi:hypothetical protein
LLSKLLSNLKTVVTPRGGEKGKFVDHAERFYHPPEPRSEFKTPLARDLQVPGVGDAVRNSTTSPE